MSKPVAKAIKLEHAMVKAQIRFYHVLYGKKKAEIRYYKYMYEKEKPVVSDKEYDMLEKSFDEIAKILKKPGSWVGCRD